jgi:hypothetical protein
MTFYLPGQSSRLALCAGSFKNATMNSATNADIKSRENASPSRNSAFGMNAKNLFELHEPAFEKRFPFSSPTQIPRNPKKKGTGNQASPLQFWC